MSWVANPQGSHSRLKTWNSTRNSTRVDVTYVLIVNTQQIKGLACTCIC
jgi:hypothetical protein